MATRSKKTSLAPASASATAAKLLELSKHEQFQALPLEVRKQRLELISDDEALGLLYDWDWKGRPKQQVPKGDWLIWLILAGRGWGKTATGAHTVRHWVEHCGRKRIALIGPTTSDCRDVMLNGESGLLNVCPPYFRPIYEPSKRLLTWPNGAIATFYSAEEPERLRGPQHDALWADELCAWQYLQETWDMAQFGLRLGDSPPTVITTTPKPLVMIRDLIKESKQPGSQVIVTGGSTYENKTNLAASFFNQVAKYEGTNLGRQELHAEVLDLEEGGIIKRSWLKLWPADVEFPEFEFIIQSYDTAFTEKTHNDPTACTVWGVFRKLDGPYCVMLLDAWDDHLEYPALRRKVKDDFREAIYGEPGHKADLVLIEEKGSGITLLQDLGRVGVPCRAYNPGRADKVSRLHTVSYLPAHGRVYIPESVKAKGKVRTWAERFVEQLCIFPNDDSMHDDYVDSFSQAMALVRDEGWLVVDPPPEPEVYADDQRARGNPYAA